MEIAKVNTKTRDLCVKCKKDLEVHQVGGGDIFNFSKSGSGAFYCNNNKCEFFGLLTLARTVKTEKVVQLKGEEEK